MGRPKKYFTILREGEVLGRFSRDEIAAGLKASRFLKDDRFKDPRDASWKPLTQLTSKVTSRGHKKTRPSKRTAKSVRRAVKVSAASQRTTYKVMKDGVPLKGRFTRVGIARKIDAGKLSLDDCYLDAESKEWVKLTEYFLFKGSKASRERYQRRTLGLSGPYQRSVDKQVEDVFRSATEYTAAQVMYSNYDFACVTCFEIARGSRIGSYYDGNCPICGGDRFTPVG